MVQVQTVRGAVAADALDAATGPGRRGHRREPGVGVPPAAPGNACRETGDVHRRARQRALDDEVLRSVLRGLDLEEATLNRD
jgi:hypothetical protein